MRGFKPRHQQKHPTQKKGMGFRPGGMIRGPGTATSDDIEAVVPEGSYIMPADSTNALGEQTLAGLGAPVPVNLSNGEYQLPPEQVHAVGVQALDQIKDATHSPTTDAGKKPEMFFADGGEVQRPYYVNRQGAASQISPNAPRLGAPQAQGALPPPQARPALPPGGVDVPSGRVSLSHLLPGGQGAAGQPAAGFQPGGFAGAQTPPPREPNWQGRASTMHHAARDTASFEAERARQDARFSQAQQQGRGLPGSQARGFVGPDGRFNAFSQSTLDARPGVRPQAGSAAQAGGGTTPRSKVGGFRAGAGRLMRGAGIVGSGYALHDMAENGINMRNTAELGASLATSNAVRSAAGQTLARGATVAGAAAPAAAVAASGFAGYQYGNHLHNKMDSGRPLNRLEAGLGFLGSRLGEGYARHAPAWMGGMDKETAQYAPEFTRMSELRAGREGAPTGSLGANAAGTATQPASPNNIITPDPGRSSDVITPDPGTSARSMTNNVTRVGNSFSASGPINEGFTINGQQRGLAPGTIRSLDDDGAPQGQGGTQGQQPYPGMPVVHGRGFRAGGPQAHLIRDTATTERQQRAALRDASTRQRGAQGLTRAQIEARNELLAGSQQEDTALQAEAMRQAGADRRAASRDAIDWMQATGDMQTRGFQARAAERLENAYDRYEKARTPEERSAAAQVIQDLQGRSRPPFQVATTEDYIDPANPMMGTRRQAYVIDPATGQGRPITGEQSQGAQFSQGRIYTDANGNLARWDGQQFVPVE